MRDSIEWLVRQLGLLFHSFTFLLRKHVVRFTDKSPTVIDITQDDIVSYGDDDDHKYVYTSYPGIGSAAGHEYLVIGNLRIKLTREQEEKIRYFFENT